ncbi:helicase-related protein [Clostridium perfringens]|nr:helicase-related protein [Clostridium perfringens]MDK0712607.1 helicase-related protein [Clostridium perfringens]
MLEIFKVYNKKDLKILERESDKILKLEKKFKILSNKDLSNKTFEFKDRLENGESLDDILYEAFAVCREATFRMLGKKHYKVQLMGGIAIHQGRIVEMKTGEGKTLTELCPAYLNSLTEQGVHIVTSNEYLAYRDKFEMEKVFNFLNISVGLVLKDTKNKKEEYLKDIIYTTNEELAFDYLRDNLVYDINDKVQSTLNFAIIDEVDSILIDDAKMPLIISKQNSNKNDIYFNIDLIVKSLNDEDYYIDEKENSIFLSDLGMIKIENKLSLGNLTLPENDEINNIIHKSLIANYLLDLDKDYIVKDGKILLIDSNTGRIADGRVFSDNLQQCLEAKEGLKINLGSRTLAKITYQNFFKIYKKISGMSGTVKTEELEFMEIYNLDVIVIPTNKKMIRIDNKDRVFINKNEKLKAIIEDVKMTTKKGQPILIGTQSIKESEEIAQLLKKNNINFKLLNAKNLEEEANIIKKAGEKNSIIVATNVAGRGTDIILTEEALKLGGLKVIGVGRSESLRIDNQLIGRAGRQGEPGESQIYISCDDTLLNIYEEDNLKSFIEKKGYNNTEIEYKYAIPYITSAQKYISSINFDIRKNTLKYDEIINLQRNIIYNERNFVLESDNLGHIISKILTKYVIRFFSSKFNLVTGLKKSEKQILNTKINYLTDIQLNNLKLEINEFLVRDFDYMIEEYNMENIYSKIYIYEVIEELINLLILDFNNNFTNNEEFDESFIKSLFLNIIDDQWKEYLEVMDYLKYCVMNETYNQKDPLQKYKIESNKIFIELNERINNTLIQNMYKLVKRSIL